MAFPFFRPGDALAAHEDTVHGANRTLWAAAVDAAAAPDD